MTGRLRILGRLTALFLVGTGLASCGVDVPRPSANQPVDRVVERRLDVNGCVVPWAALHLALVSSAPQLGTTTIPDYFCAYVDDRSDVLYVIPAQDDEDFLESASDWLQSLGWRSSPIDDDLRQAQFERPETGPATARGAWIYAVPTAAELPSGAAEPIRELLGTRAEDPLMVLVAW